MKEALLLYSLLFVFSVSAKETIATVSQNASIVKLQQDGDEFKKVKDSFSEKSPFKFVDSFLNFGAASSEASDQDTTILSEYLDSAKVEDVFEYRKKNSDISGPIVRYIDPQDDLEEPIWKTVNHKLRNNLVLNEDESSFANGLKKSLSKLPKVEGITFRGASVTSKTLEKYFPGAEISEKGFLSTTLDARIAHGFAFAQVPDSPKQADRWSVVFIINGKSGRYISFFVPTNMHEIEILFPTNTSFQVKRVVKDPKTQTATVWLTESKK